ncbi:alpha/beta hydrolase [Nitrospirillum sp. BR 11828]|uniref:alpha/beta hydrolase n=1 Tax=Nitrospirillum sp. BR 11828 TaxID=3104325 RepID=UPI002ACA16F5|nr:alpha/beta hydrolase [Nitrospirillum sp. BR 11828]MDZ5648775.1 alpha/beta hydrolase [Nitrospirillum sp. BR 11828]
MAAGAVTNMVYMVVLIALVIGVLLLGSLVMTLSREGGAALFVHPRLPDPGAPPDGSGLRAVAYPTADGATLTAWTAEPTGARPLVLILAGPGQRRADLAGLASALVANGYGVMLTCRRPASLITGEWGEAALLADARAALDHLTARGVSGSRLVILAVSAAAALALQMAWERRPAALVLAAPPTSGAELLVGRWHLAPLAGMAANPLAVVRRLAVAPPACPLLVLHGLADRSVPPAMGRAVFQAAPEPKQAAWIKGAGHADLWDKGGTDALLDFLAGRKGPATTLEQEAPRRAPGLPAVRP